VLVTSRRFILQARTSPPSLVAAAAPRCAVSPIFNRRLAPVEEDGPLELFNTAAWLMLQLMALVRILVDGYSLLHNWPELAPGWPRHSAFAREELIRRLTQYQDFTGTPVTIFFDGSAPGPTQSLSQDTREVEVLFSQSGQTADQLIERAAHRFAPYGEVLAVTDDFAERDTVISLGGLASSCWNFIQMVENTLAEQADVIKDHNRQERHRFKKGR